MCGIASVIGEGSSLEELESILARISHRGNKEHQQENADAGFCKLGTNRLDIVDRDNAKQPISTADGRYTVVFNGEIYNHKELKEELSQKGHTFKTDSDTETIVVGYAEWGNEVVHKLDGMFAFVIFDKEENTFFAARDPIGIKPLYWAKTNSDLYYFSSEMKGLAPIESIETIELFPPGAYMENGVLSQYWSTTNFQVDNSIKESEAVETVRKLFDEAVKKRVQTDLPVAVYVSGGVDSTSVLATAVKYHPDVTAIIAGNEHSSDKEFAIKYCEENGIKYKVRELPTEEELFSTVPEIIRITESFEPNMIRQSPISYEIAKTASEFKVILCGEGADELFAGYPEFKDISENEIPALVNSFLSDLYRTQLQRVDRTSMAVTTEVRVPFLDRALVEYVLSIPPDLKMNEETTKYVLREAVKDRLPEYIYNREKAVLSEGAGFRGNQKEDGLFSELIDKLENDDELESLQKEYPEWALETKEEVYYFKYFLENQYHKAEFNKRRTTVNKTNSLPI